MSDGDLHKRARRSLWLVLSRQLVVAALTFGSGIVLARTLEPSDFGMFAIAVFVVAFAGMMTDLGLHAALVQRSAEISDRELRTVFTLQQLAVTAAMVVVWPAAAWLTSVYPKSSPELVGLVRLMSLDLYIQSWCRPGEALIERNLRYERLVPIDVAATCAYCILAIALALAGYGVWSFGFAFVGSTLTRLVLVRRAAPWSVRFEFDRATAGVLLRAGIPLQFGRVVAQAQYWITPTIVAGTLGPAAAGLLQWAAGNGRKPLDVLEYLARVSLPHFSRLQDDEDEVERTLLRYVTGFVLVSGLWLAVLAVAGRDLVVLIYTERWLPAVPAMVLFAAVGLFVSVRVVVTTALAGMGRTMLIARASVAAAVATILASIGLVLLFGFIGVPLGQLLGAAAVLPLLAVGLRAGATRGILLSVRTAAAPAISATLVGFAADVWAGDFYLAGLTTSAAMTAAYCAVAWWSGPEWLRARVRADWASVRNNFARGVQ
jgi:O-antigen/teichoic acid export membrane protein